MLHIPPSGRTGNVALGNIIYDARSRNRDWKCCTVTYDARSEGLPGKCCTVTYDARSRGIAREGEMLHGNIIL